MKLFTRIAVLFYVTLVLFIGAFILVFVLNWIEFRSFGILLYFAYSDAQMRVMAGLLGVVLLILNFMFAKLISDEDQREKTIAFDNPSGRVSVSLAALSDLVRRVIAKVPEVKEVKSEIAATKKGLVVTARLILKVDVNIPEMTSHLQGLVKRKIQKIIGLEEDITVKIHVIKILPAEIKQRPHKEEDFPAEDQESPGNIPFQGYRP